MSRFLMRPSRLDIERLAGEIADAESRQQTEASDNEEIKRLLCCARTALDRRNLSLGWDYVRRIRELMLRTMSASKLRVEAIELRREATAKIDKGRADKDAWRRQSMLELLEPIQDEVTDEDEIRMRLEHALRLRAGYFDGMHFKNRKWQYTTNCVCLVMVGMVVLLTISFSVGSLGAVASHQGVGGIEDLKVVSTVVFFGVLGATFSTLRTLTSGAARYTEIRIPQQFLDLSTSLRRLFIGAGASLVAYLLVLRTDDVAETPFLYLAAFAAGFSDNLVEKGIEEVQKRSGGA